jgi:phosphoribosylaminoimidazole-succinocarboxamide synthase
VPLFETDLPGLPKRRGKVRDVYDLGDDRLLIVATDRISAFDWVLPTAIPDKGRVLTALSAWWFRTLDSPKYRHHLLSTDLGDTDLKIPEWLRGELEGRVMVVKKTRVIPFECVVRGHLAGSGWKEYRSTGSITGIPLPSGLVEGDALPEPIFTPATKAEAGHDENVPLSRLIEELGDDLASFLRDASIGYYGDAYERARARGLLLADTKFEFGFLPGAAWPILIDEVLTPDSSRYWSLATWKPGGPQPSFDKQFVRDWLDASGWDKQSPPPPLPDNIVAKTREKYIECFEILTGQPFPWK